MTRIPILIDINNFSFFDLWNKRGIWSYESIDYHTCPYCEQAKIPFKLGICICGKQVSKIRHVDNAENFIDKYYFYLDVD